MSSSHQKGRLIKLHRKLECPSCGHVSMVIKKGKTTMADGIQINDISRWVCSNCGEEVFDPKTLSEIRQQRTAKLKAACA